MMTTRTKDPLFQDIHADDNDQEITEIESLCLSCSENGVTRIFLTKIPHYKEIILMSFSCPHCGFRNNETQFGGKFQERGIRLSLRVQNQKDMNRQVVKSDYASIKIPELEFEIPARNQKGEITTIEGILNKAIGDLEYDKEAREKADASTAAKIAEFLEKLASYKNVEKPFHFIVDDPSGNSFIENPFAPQNDIEMKTTHYVRSDEQNSVLGILINECDKETEFAANDELCLSSEVVTFHTNCHLCNSPCETNMKPTKIPHFKEVVIMATTCDACGHRSNEVKSGAGIEPLGQRITLLIDGQCDLNRDVLKSETCAIEIPELELEVGSGSISGRFTTVEGLLENVHQQLEQSYSLLLGDSSLPKQQEKMTDFLDTLNKVKSGNLTVHLVLDDPAGNSYLQSLDDTGKRDPHLEIVQYERSFEQNEDLGLNDMKTEDYGEES